MSSAKLILLPIEWKPGNAENVIEGFIGIYKVGSITAEGDSFRINVWKEEVKIASCELKFTQQTIASCLEQAKNYITSKITDRIISEQSVLNKFYRILKWHKNLNFQRILGIFQMKKLELKK